VALERQSRHLVEIYPVISLLQLLIDSRF